MYRTETSNVGLQQWPWRGGGALPRHGLALCGLSCLCAEPVILAFSALLTPSSLVCCDLCACSAPRVCVCVCRDSFILLPSHSGCWYLRLFFVCLLWRCFFLFCFLFLSLSLSLSLSLCSSPCLFIWFIIPSLTFRLPQTLRTQGNNMAKVEEPLDLVRLRSVALLFPSPV